MFKKTRIRLTILNSLVFIILISIIGFIIYSYVNSYIYKDIDRSLRNSINRLEKGLPIQNAGSPNGGPQQMIIPLVWDKQKQLLNRNDLLNSEYFQKNRSKFIQDKYNTIEDIKVSGTNYRAISVQAIIKDTPIVLEFIRSTEIEKHVMDQLLMIMIVGCIIGSIFAIIAGLFLADKALKPIKNAWDKQQQFVSDASHELRTPLAIIQTRGELLLQEPNASIQEKASDISIVLKECRRLTKLVSNLLTLARSDSNEIEMEKEEFFLDELLKDMVDHFSEVALYQGKQITLGTSPPITFFGDKDRIHQLLVILLDNAMKYTNDGGHIKISSYENKQVIGIIIEDNGIGMKEEELTKIFDRFYQVDKSRSKSNSLGLGLSIAKWIVDKHAGKIKVESTFGVGTRFELQFSKKLFS
ncbi:sensor histidine kinase [Heyndrickxia sp. NPDC080065]|uniref:sensor histidine kinase n=1 Tax=Heyndrickxia sp. NPDC080065 TaxID=3390568 RepID=UPI003D055410